MSNFLNLIFRAYRNVLHYRQLICLNLNDAVADLDVSAGFAILLDAVGSYIRCIVRFSRHLYSYQEFKHISCILFLCADCCLADGQSGVFDRVPEFNRCILIKGSARIVRCAFAYIIWIFNFFHIIGCIRHNTFYLCTLIVFQYDNSVCGRFRCPNRILAVCRLNYIVRTAVRFFVQVDLKSKLIIRIAADIGFVDVECYKRPGRHRIGNRYIFSSVYFYCACCFCFVKGIKPGSRLRVNAGIIFFCYAELCVQQNILDCQFFIRAYIHQAAADSKGSSAAEA